MTEAIAGMLVNAFKSKEIPEQEKIIQNLTVILDSLPDLLKKAPQK